MKLSLSFSQSCFEPRKEDYTFSPEHSGKRAGFAGWVVRLLHAPARLITRRSLDKVLYTDASVATGKPEQDADLTRDLRDMM